MTALAAAIAELLDVALRPAVSILMPAHRGLDVRQDPIRLKNLLREAGGQLEARGLTPDDAARVLAPVRERIEDREFWRQGEGGIALYAAPNFFRSHRVARAFHEVVTVADRFHVLQLLAARALDDRFYVLALSQKDVRLVEGTQDEAREVDLGDLPRSLPEMLLTDLPEPQLQPVFQGHGDVGTLDRKEAIRQFFHRLERGLHPHLADRSAPLVLAAVDYLVPLYRETNTYPALLPDAIAGNPERIASPALAARGRDLVRRQVERTEARLARRFNDLVGLGRASSHLGDVLRAAHAGRVADLLVADVPPRWGTFEPASGALAFHERPGALAEDLLNLAAVLTLGSRGAVHVVAPSRLPRDAEVAAIFRY